ncbi:hypothetical protein [Rheinheimera sp. UJ63]|uniref:hypothetical protein n=1 Tax=Rheinheimera sp. UJ63 TaxID=2910157 RepID=UPI001F376DF6|nr:hypothetical protein [Rheinheimera sp. UJ63]MCF4009495.1 hypothetical protein [Rheinheimera sp. UJ63]
MTDHERTSLRDKIRNIIDLKIFVLSVSIVFMVSALISWYTDFSFWWTALLVAVAVLANGIIIAFEKDI